MKHGKVQVNSGFCNTQPIRESSSLYTLDIYIYIWFTNRVSIQFLTNFRPGMSIIHNLPLDSYCQSVTFSIISHHWFKLIVFIYVHSNGKLRPSAPCVFALASSMLGEGGGRSFMLCLPAPPRGRPPRPPAVSCCVCNLVLGIILEKTYGLGCVLFSDAPIHGSIKGVKINEVHAIDCTS
jgi:hypothetical protein